MSGEIGILSVGAGDTKLSFDPSNPADCIRAARVVKDMLKRGYALLVENPPGSKKYTRAHGFDDKTHEYIIADFDPIVAQEHDQNEPAPTDAAEPAAAPGRSPREPKSRIKLKRIPAGKTRSVAVARSAGG